MRDAENARRLRREWYHRNRQREAEKQRVRKQNKTKLTRDFINSIKETNPCSDCGNKYPYYVMDFDHRHGKKWNVSRMVSMSINLVIIEIDKCDLVCANCHRVRTHRRNVV